jgi:hypothetical protein
MRKLDNQLKEALSFDKLDSQFSEALSYYKR